VKEEETKEESAEDVNIEGEETTKEEGEKPEAKEAPSLEAIDKRLTVVEGKIAGAEDKLDQILTLLTGDDDEEDKEAKPEEAKAAEEEAPEAELSEKQMEAVKGMIEAEKEALTPRRKKVPALEDPKTKKEGAEKKSPVATAAERLHRA